MLVEEYPNRNYLRVISARPSLLNHYPKIFRQLQEYVGKRVYEELTPEESKKIEEELKDHKGLVSVSQKEKEIDERLGKIVEGDQRLKDIAAALEALDREKGYRISEIEVTIGDGEEEEEATTEEEDDNGDDGKGEGEGVPDLTQDNIEERIQGIQGEGNQDEKAKNVMIWKLRQLGWSEDEIKERLSE